ncbi:MAG: sulfatase [Geminicoccaceae bacterium]
MTTMVLWARYLRAAFLACSLVAAVIVGICAWATPAEAAARPNVVVLLADDMNADDLPYMPHTLARLAQQGVTFDAYYANVSLCDPSRATFLTGKYTQNTKVLTNNYAQFLKGGNETRNIATILQAAGYRTALIGKYLNSATNATRPDHVPPGWTYWFALDGGDLYGQYNYQVNENGTHKRFGSAVTDFATDVYRDRALTFIKGAAAAKVPYFCYLAFSAPHSPSTPALRYQDWFPNTQLPNKPSRNESDVSDKPDYIQSLLPLTTSKLSFLGKSYRKRLRSLQAVDEAVEAVFKAIGATGLTRTYVIFASDNGFLLGEHRATGKSGPYEEMVKQVLLVRGPGVVHGFKSLALVGNVDIAPTILDWAGLPIPEDMDGRSLKGQLTLQLPARWRVGYPLRLAGSTD